MKHGFIKFLNDQRGSVMTLSALMFPVVIGLAGVGLDVSSWMMTKRDLQTAADAAAIAGAWEIANGYDDEAESVAIKEAQANGYDPDLDGSLDFEVTVNEEGQTVVSATIQQRANIFFSSMFLETDVYTATAASSVVIEPTGGFCILALDEEQDASFSAVGTVSIDATECGIAVNSDSDTAMDLTGVVSLDIGDLSIVGDYEIGSNVTLQYNDLNLGVSRFRDPYSDLEVEEHDSCSAADIRRGNSYSRSVTLSPGTYCGGLTLSGNNDVTFEPGVYYIDGGDFKVTGNGSLYGEGVSFVLTNSNTNDGDWANLNISGGKEVFFSAPAEGEDMEGVVFYQDRDTPESSTKNKLTGTSSIILEGAAYFPSRGIDFGGNNDATSPNENPCTRLIAKTVTMHGTPSMGNNCDGTSVRDIGYFNVKLIM